MFYDILNHMGIDTKYSMYKYYIVNGDALQHFAASTDNTIRIIPLQSYIVVISN